ncbi:MAG: CD225/dispanin family protein [Muribaculaceae bacterium]|nr:CD225/dispanin family protein [Muribaculaceae bacterium]
MKYYIAENGQPAGPFEVNELLAHGMTVNSQVWCETMENWTAAGQVPELMPLLGIEPQPAVLPEQPAYQPEQQAYQPEQPAYQPEQPAYQPEQPAYEPQQQQAYQPQQQAYQPQQQPYQQGQPSGGYAQPQYAQPQYAQPLPAIPKNWMTESVLIVILSALCCCNPISFITGIVALVNAGKVKSAYERGDMFTAQESSKSAKTWTLISLVIMLLSVVVGIVILMTSPAFMESISQAMQEVQ